MSQTPQTSEHSKSFPNANRLEEEKLKHQAEQQARFDRCYPIFEKLRSELIQNYYDWYLTIEPDTGEHFLDRDHLTNLKKAREKFPDAVFCTFCINETGACGRI